MNRTHLSAAIAFACLMGTGTAMAQSNDQQTTSSQVDAAKSAQRANVSSTSNTSAANDTKRVQQLSTVQVHGQSLSLGGGLMSVQTAPKAVSTISRDAIVKAAPGSNFTQLVTSVPGVNSSTDDVTGLSDGNYSIRGFASNEIGVTVNGAPINDSGSYSVFASEYGDSENVGDITVEQGIPDVDMPDSGAAGGHIAWATIDPSHTAGLDFTQSLGSHDYRRTFLRLNTGDIGPVRSWLSYSDNSVDKWRGAGDLEVTKVDGKSIWTIDDSNSISASLQYNRENRDSYESVTKAQVAKTGYFTDWDTTFKPGSNDANFYRLHTNPFQNYLFSLDGEFKLSDSTHLAVIPYFQWGGGGSGSGNSFFQETTNGSTNEFENANQDLNQDGQIVVGPNGKKSVVYEFSHSTTWRPGVLFKFNQDLGLDNSLEYGLWYERPRQEQSQTAGLASFETGVPNDLWGNSNFVLYPDGQVQKVFQEYTQTEVKKGFVTDTWTPNDQWLFTLGAAYLHVERQGSDFEFPGNQGGFDPAQFGGPNLNATFHKVTPTFGVKFSPDDNNQFFYGVGKSFRAPPNTAVALNDVTDRPANKPESAWNNDLGWRFYGDRFSASAMLYRSNFHDKTLSGFDQTTDETFSTQIDRVRMQGFNSEASFNFTSNWKIYGSYTYTQAKVESDFDAGDDGIYPTKGKSLINTPRNIGYAALSYDNGPLWASLTGTYHSSIYGDLMNTETAGGYSTFGINAGYRFSDWSEWFKKPYIKFNISNLTDHRAFTNANNASTLASNPGGVIKGVDGTTLFTTTPDYSLLEPRTFMVTVGASFF